MANLGEEFGALLAVFLLVFLAVKWDRGRRRVVKVVPEKDNDSVKEIPAIKKEQKKEVLPQEPALQEVPIKRPSSQKTVVLLAVSVRVKVLKKNDSVITWFKQASCYWVGGERAWQRVLVNLEKNGVNAREHVFLKDVEQQEDNFDVIIAFRSIFWQEKPRLDTFLAVINVVRDANPDPKEIDYYCYPRELNLLNQKFGFRKTS